MAKNRRPQIVLSEEDRRRLEHIKTSRQSPAKHVCRAKIILHLGDGLGLAKTMRAVGMSKPTVWRWWDRYLKEGVDGILYDKPHRRGLAPVPEETVAELITLAMSPPPEPMSQWTLRALAERLGLAISTVYAIMERNGLKPHKVKILKVSRDPNFERKIRDIVGLYVDPPDHAVILSAGGEPLIEALGRTQEPRPMKLEQAEMRVHDDKHHGTTGLMAALDRATDQMVRRHRSEEFLAFLDLVAAGIGPGTGIHVILDTVSPHKWAMANEWLKDRPNWTFHFTSTPAAWTDAVDGVFSKLARRRSKHAVCNSVDACIAAIAGYIERHNADDARPFRWSRKP